MMSPSSPRRRSPHFAAVDALTNEVFMFAVIFEVCPRPAQWDAYLAYARWLRPELEQIDGFVENIRYRSITRPGWILSLSTWRDERAVVRWRTHAAHHEIQQKGRDDVFADYHLRVGQFIEDGPSPKGTALDRPRSDMTETGAAKVVTVIDRIDRIDRKRCAELGEGSSPLDVANLLGVDPSADGLVAWDGFDAVLSPGDLVLLTSWRDEAFASAYEAQAALPEGARLRRVHVLRDYGMFDRREAPQYHRAVVRSSA